MMDCTDRHCRFFLRLVSPRARLYTEMVTTGALLPAAQIRLEAQSVYWTWTVTQTKPPAELDRPGRVVMHVVGLECQAIGRDGGLHHPPVARQMQKILTKQGMTFKLARKVTHRSIARVFDVGEAGG